MLEEIIHRDDLTPYLVSFPEGSELFYEGEESRDLFILVSGRVDIVKSGRKIAEIEETGAVLGEMAYLTGGGRTAGARAQGAVSTIRVPADEIPTFLEKHPAVLFEIAHLLSRRLKETSQIRVGLEAFCDQLPDAVFLTDEKERILSWNHAAEDLYGYPADKVLYRPFNEIFDDRRLCAELLEALKTQGIVREKVLKLRHPGLGIRYVSASMQRIWGGNGETQGFVVIGRDVTGVKKLERRFRRSIYWLVPSLALLIGLGALLYHGYPYFHKGQAAADTERVILRDQILRDFRFLESSLLESGAWLDPELSKPVLASFLASGQKENGIYSGIVLLDSDKRVLTAWSASMPDAAERLAGSSYAAIPFEGREGSRFSILTPYYYGGESWGHPHVEIAGRVSTVDRFMGWLVLQMNMARISGVYRMSVDELRTLQLDAS